MSHSYTIHHTPDPYADTRLPDTHQDTYSKTVLGFWMYLMTDCLVFATLFLTYAVLHDKIFGAPSSKDIFNLSLAFIETMILLFSTFSCGFGMLAALKSQKNHVIGWLTLTFLLGISFVFIEIT